MAKRILIDGIPSKQHWLYGRFSNIKTRCSNKNTWQYKYYGGRGIEFRFKAFTDFLKYVSSLPRYKDVRTLKLTLDRIDNNGHYEVGNLRWATGLQQSINQSKYKNNKSGTTGVGYRKEDGLWCARIRFQGKSIFLKSSKNKEACIKARKEGEVKYFGPHY